ECPVWPSPARSFDPDTHRKTASTAHAIEAVVLSAAAPLLRGAGDFHDLCPALQLGIQNLGKLFRRGRDGYDAGKRHLLLELGLVHRLDDGLAQGVSDVVRDAIRREDSHP